MRYPQYGSRVIAATERDATYMLDVILGNETAPEILEHTTDTAGYTDLVFARFDLLGLDFTPRLRDIADQKLSKVKGLDVAYPALKFTGQVNPEYLARHWEELVRVAGSLKLGYVKPSSSCATCSTSPCAAKSIPSSTKASSCTRCAAGSGLEATGFCAASRKKPSRNSSAV